tara:strand:+ start:794 stop:1954 length:1161 start_codon:yes stop_codon:yes gene_type:complete
VAYSNQALELKYYIQEGISPVHYKISNLEEHLQIRESLYRLLGILPNFIENREILEVAPGSGHNSFFTAYLLPKSYDLVEPNPKGQLDIIRNFKKLKIKHTKPRLHKKAIENFNTKKKYDLVMTEGWPGGYLKYDKKMLKKISSFVKPGGMLFISFLPPSGTISTCIRRLIGKRLINNKQTLNEKTDILKKSFSSHLYTMQSMTRSHEHWIQDSLLNPYINLAHNNPSIALNVLGKKFEIYNSVPKLNLDWRWYKSIHGKNKFWNEIFLKNYFSMSHCLIDYRIDNYKRSLKKNENLENLCMKFILLANKYENSGIKNYKNKLRPILLQIIKNIKGDLPKSTTEGIIEADKILLKTDLDPIKISSMKKFISLFGREQCYLTFTKKK